MMMVMVMILTRIGPVSGDQSPWPEEMMVVVVTIYSGGDDSDGDGDNDDINYDWSSERRPEPVTWEDGCGDDM